MISLNLVLACLIWGGAALVVFEVFWYYLEKRLNLLKHLPAELREASNVGALVSRIVIQMAFMVAMPAIGYAWFYILVPFYGTRAGVGMAIFLFMLGIIPFVMSLLMRIRLPIAFMLFQLAGHLLKMIIIFGIIAYLYVL